MTPKLKKEYKKKHLGINEWNENVYLSIPTWDCSWYWGFGYIGNINHHYHLSSLFGKTNMYDGIKSHFKEFILKEDNKIWSFCEIVTTIYKLKDIAEVYNRGGNHYSSNPLAELIKNKEEYERINMILIPELIDEMYKILNNE